MPLGGHPKFVLWATNRHFRVWELKGIGTVSHLLHAMDGRPYTFQELQNAFNLTSSHFLTYSQMTGFFFYYTYLIYMQLLEITLLIFCGIRKRDIHCLLFT